MPKGGMSGHTSHGNGDNVWLTPPGLIKALGYVDLDPCAADDRPWPTAYRHFVKADDGLSKQWNGFVYVNPPYDAEAGRWLSRLADHGNGIALIFARTETEAFHSQLWDRADALFFFRGRLFFHYPDGRRAPHNAGAPSVLAAYGQTAVTKLERIDGEFKHEFPGRLIRLR